MKPNISPIINANINWIRFMCKRPKSKAEINIANLSPNFRNIPSMMPLNTISSTIPGMIATAKISAIIFMVAKLCGKSGGANVVTDCKIDAMICAMYVAPMHITIAVMIFAKEFFLKGSGLFCPFGSVVSVSMMNGKNIANSVVIARNE